jgi:hypothetical protein
MSFLKKIIILLILATIFFAFSYAGDLEMRSKIKLTHNVYNYDQFKANQDLLFKDKDSVFKAKLDKYSKVVKDNWSNL